ncbi:hypothetical protein JCM10213_006614 [Rhodosporidiobolus nylandii]
MSVAPLPTSHADDDSFESWDSDPDLDLPTGPLLLPTFNVSSASLSSGARSRASSVAASHAGEEGERRPESGFFEELDERLREGRDRDDDGNESSMDSSRTSTTTGTLKDLMGGLTLTGEGDQTVSFSPSSSTSTSPAFGEETPRPERKATTLRASSSLSQLLSTSLSPSTRGRGKVTHLGSTRPGEAVEVGEGDWDQDLDLGGLGLPVPAGAAGGEGAGEARRIVGKKGSFASHLSLGSDAEEDDDELREPRKKISIASFSDAGVDDVDGFADDFDLPEQATFALAPSLALNSRGSLASLRSTTSSASHSGGAPSAPPLSPAPAAAQLPRTPTSLAPPPATSPAPSSPGALSPSKPSDSSSDDESDVTERETDAEDDAAFFEDLILPPFLGGSTSAALLTPPTSEGEPDAPSPLKGRVDLQSLLRTKLEQRGGRGLLFHTAPGSPTPHSGSPGAPESPEDPRLAKHRESPEDGSGADLARELRRGSLPGGNGASGAGEKGAEEDEEQWSAREMRERMRTISSGRAREAQLAKEARAAKGGKGRVGMMRRTMSEGKVPPLPSSSAFPSSSAGSRRPGMPPSRASTTGGFPHPPSRLARPASAQGDRPERPPSAASSNGTAVSGTSARRGPPPAPSTASRDRVRMRTISMRTVGSSSDLRSAASLSGRGNRPAKLDVPQGGKRSLSPVPMTPMTPTTASSSSSGPSRLTLRPKRSQQHLAPASASSSSSLGGTTAARALERKRSLQNLSTLATVPASPASSSRPSSRQTLSRRSPSPAGSRLPSFAAPTTASTQRVRERVQSNPVLPPHPPATPTTPSSASAFGLFRAPQTPSDRLLRPTLSSASKTRPTPSSRPTSPLKPATLLPRPLSRPVPGAAPSKKQTQEYGDGTELDGFDDLPVSKEREKERVVSVGNASRKSSGASTATVKGGSWGRKTSAATAAAQGESKSRLPLPKRTSGGEVRGKKEGAAVGSKVKPAPGAKKDEKGKAKETSGGEKKKKRREPHLIRHLGGNGGAVKVHGEMTYNPRLHRWEGNESILREFDKALSTSTRPALISPFSSTMGSPARTTFPAPDTSSRSGTPAPADQPALKLPPGASQGASRAGIKVVGDMVFDPATCSWHALAGPDAEDELELDWGAAGASSSGEAADGEEDEDGWEAGERERMLRNRESFVLEEGSSEGSAGEEAEKEKEDQRGDGRRKKQTKRQMWREGREAVERVKGEMEGWITRSEESEAEEGRRWLWELRALIMNPQ